MDELVAVGQIFQEVKQDSLPEGHPFRSFSSPSLLLGDKVLFGTKAENGSCTLDTFSEEIRQVLPSYNERNKIGRAHLLSQTGSWGSVLTVLLCPVCKPALAASLASIGAGFLASESFLKPLLILLLVATVSGLLWSYLRQHRNVVPVLSGIFFSTSVYVGRYIYFGATLNSALTWVGVTGLIGIGIWNLFLHKNNKAQSNCAGNCGTRSAS